ncbi:hypothetical protein ACOMHN_067639 [Nucella lapillus]
MGCGGYHVRSVAPVLVSVHLLSMAADQGVTDRRVTITPRVKLPPMLVKALASTLLLGNQGTLQVSPGTPQVTPCTPQVTPGTPQANLGTLKVNPDIPLGPTFRVPMDNLRQQLG